MRCVCVCVSEGVWQYQFTRKIEFFKLDNKVYSGELRS